MRILSLNKESGMEAVFFGTLLRELSSGMGVGKSAKRFSRSLAKTIKPKRCDLAKTLIGLKNNIGGSFKVHSLSDSKIVLHGCQCPFGDPLGHPELCQVTQTVFEDISRGCCKGATVEITRSIARGDSMCRVEILAP